jgi:hypothetical protein
MQITVIRRVPQRQVGICGVVPHRAFDQFEAELDQLESSGVLVERIDADAFPHRTPVIRINGELLCEGRYPGHHEWVRAVGEARRREPPLWNGTSVAAPCR